MKDPGSGDYREDSSNSGKHMWTNTNLTFTVFDV